MINKALLGSIGTPINRDNRKTPLTLGKIAPARARSGPSRQPFHRAAFFYALVFAFLWHAFGHRNELVKFGWPDGKSVRNPHHVLEGYDALGPLDAADVMPLKIA